MGLVSYRALLIEKMSHKIDVDDEIISRDPERNSQELKLLPHILLKMEVKSIWFT